MIRVTKHALERATERAFANDAGAVVDWDVVTNAITEAVRGGEGAIQIVGVRSQGHLEQIAVPVAGRGWAVVQQDLLYAGGNLVVVTWLDEAMKQVQQGRGQILEGRPLPKWWRRRVDR